MMVNLRLDKNDYAVQRIHQVADNSYKNFGSRLLDDSPEDRSFSYLQTEYQLSEKILLEDAFKREMMNPTTVIRLGFSTDEIYAAIYFISFLKDYDIPKRFYLVVCFLLNKNNRPVLMFFMPDEGIKKIALIKQTLESNIQYAISEILKQAPIDKDTLKYLYICCLHLGNRFFTMGIKKQLLKYLPDLDAFDVNPSNTEHQNQNSHLDHLEIEAEGSVYDRARDPPGQRSVYIPPGDTASEKYRLSTFIKFPSESPANPRELANAGFFYTGYKDRVKCFSCSRGVENWQSDDDVKHSSWHRDNCDFYYGRDTTNIPIAIRRGNVRVMAGQSSSSSSSSRARDDSGTGSSASAPPPNEIPSAGEALVGGGGGESATYQTARAVGGNRRMNYLENFTLASTSTTDFERFLKSKDLRREDERLTTFRDWDDDSVSRNDLARDGFFYLGNYDRVQCFSCGGILRNWHRGDIVRNEHISHFPTCRMVRQQETRNRAINRPAADNRAPPNHRAPNDQGRNNNMFPCLYPVNAHMREYQSRMATFDRRWTMTHIRATKDEIAQAGFYFLGERDRVKCWYCNGGLQNWEPNDDPWTEHAKWFPQCEFLLRSKGLEFVTRLVAQFPDLPRPVLRNPYDVPPEGSYNQSRNNPSPPPPIIDPRADEQEELKKVEELMKSEVVQSVIEMGFTTQLVKKVLLTRMRDELPEYTSVSALMDDVEIAENNEEDIPPMSPLTLSPPGDVSGPSSSSTTSQDPERRIQELQDERKCKVCLDRMAEVVFIPCGHLCCCMSCASAMKKCPICRKKIEQSIRTYQS